MPPSHFRILRRAFTRRFLEHEVFAASGDIREPLADFLGILVTFGIAVSYLLMMVHSGTPASTPQWIRDQMIWGDLWILTTISIGVAAAFVIVCWETLFPDLTDCLVLSAQPVRMRTVFLAKAGAVVPVFAALVAAANLFPLLIYPVLISRYVEGTKFQWLLAQLATIAASSAFVLAAAVALQCALINILPYRWFQRASAYVQAALLGGVLAMLFVPPPPSPEMLVIPKYRVISAIFPSYWFMGVYKAMIGGASPEILRLVRFAVLWSAAALAASVFAYSFGYARFVRRTIEGGGVSRAPEHRRREWASALRRRLLPDSRERAVAAFIWRTMSRSRTHRLMLAGYIGVGAAYVVIGVAKLVERKGWSAALYPDATFAAVPIVISFFALLGMRMVFSLPVNLKANWVFRMLEAERPEADLMAVRKVMLAIGVAPAALISAVAFPAMWGASAGFRFAAVVMLISLLVLELLMREFRKLPFTCSYMPGKANLKLTLGFYICAFSIATVLIAKAAVEAASRPWVFVLVAGVSAAALGALVWMRRQSDDGPLIYEETHDWQVIKLELS
jgi:hypothetical protein